MSRLSSKAITEMLVYFVAGNVPSESSLEELEQTGLQTDEELFICAAVNFMREHREEAHRVLAKEDRSDGFIQEVIDASDADPANW